MMVGSRGAEAARDHLLTSVPTASPETSVEDALAALPGGRYDDVGAVYVVDDAGKLLGSAPLTELLSRSPAASLGEVMRVDCPTVPPDADQERVASLALRHDTVAIPVVDAAGVFRGVVPARALLRILRREHVEDLHHLAGIRHEEEHARHALEEPPARRARDRLPWLTLGLAGSAVATFVMSRFASQLESNVALAFFVPAIVYLVDAIGTQTETVAVRGLSLSHAPIRSLLRGELQTGLLIGLAFACVTFAGVSFAFADSSLALVVALTILIAGALATTIGLLLPWLLHRLNQDPAFGSGPIATIIQDVLSLLVFFLLSGLFLFR